MLLPILILLAVVLSVGGFILGLYEAIWAIPLVFLAVFIIIFLIWTLSCVICSRFISMEKDLEEQNKICRIYADGILGALPQLMNIKIQVTGKEILPKEKFLLVCNHKSSMDPVLTMSVLRKEHTIGFVAKKQLFKLPVISRLMYNLFCLNLDRGNIKESAKVIIRTAEIIKSGKASMGIYPEGKRNLGDGLLPFMDGAFKIAKKADCPVVVATIRNTEKIVKRTPFRRTVVQLNFIGVLDKEFVAEHKTGQISEKVQEMMALDFC